MTIRIVVLIGLVNFVAASQSKTCPPVRAKNADEALKMESSSNKNGCWQRDSTSGKLVFLSDRTPDDAYKPLIPTPPDQPQPSKRSVPPEIKSNPSMSKLLIGTWHATDCGFANGAILEIHAGVGNVLSGQLTGRVSAAAGTECEGAQLDNTATAMRLKDLVFDGMTLDFKLDFSTAEEVDSGYPIEQRMSLASGTLTWVTPKYRMKDGYYQPAHRYVFTRSF